MTLQIKIEIFLHNDYKYRIHTMQVHINSTRYTFNYREDMMYMNADSRMIEDRFNAELNKIMIEYIKLNYIPKPSNKRYTESHDLNYIWNRTGIPVLNSLGGTISLDKALTEMMDYLYYDVDFYVSRKHLLPWGLIQLINEDKLREEFPEAFL